MGEMYRARETKLNRDVAIKVLPESLSPFLINTLSRDTPAAPITLLMN